MRQVEDRNPAWITHRLIEANGPATLWCAWFRVPSHEDAVLASDAFKEAGAIRAIPLAGASVFVEFEPTRVRRIAAAAVAHHAVPLGSGQS
jgi:hypothetical protein